MNRILEYTARGGEKIEDVLIKYFGLTKREISRAKFTPGGLGVVDKCDSSCAMRGEGTAAVQTAGAEREMYEVHATGRSRQVNIKYIMQSGEVLRVILGERGAAGGRPRPVPANRTAGLVILYEDTDLIVVDKPAGVAVHPAHGHYDDTVVNWLAAYFTQRREDIVSHVIGRLDKDTSGVLLFAKNRPAAGRLARQRKSGELTKVYLAIVNGVPQPREGVIDFPLGDAPGELMKQTVNAVAASGNIFRTALTRYKVIREFELAVQAPAEKRPGFTHSSNDMDGFFPDDKSIQSRYSLVECVIDTGRTHQIRVHMAAIGHPLLGDVLYQAEDASEPFLPDAARKLQTRQLDQLFPHLESPADARSIATQKDVAAAPSRAMLHARSISFTHPFTAEHVTVESPLPEDFKALLK